MNRRKFLASGLVLAAGFVGLAGTAQAAAPIYIVELASFDCPYCRAYERIHDAVDRIARGAGGRLVFSPIPTREDSTGARERVYYAFASRYPEHEPWVRAALFEASQDLGLPLNTTAQTLDALGNWTGNNRPAFDPDVVTKHLSSRGNEGLMRALFLAREAAISRVPAYVLVQDGEIRGVVARRAEDDPERLLKRLERAVAELSAENGRERTQ